MRGVTWHRGCPVPIEDLRLVTMAYWGFDNRAHTGRLVVNAHVTEGVVRAFHQMYDARFPLRRMVPIHRYDGDDNRSMVVDNTSAFNCRSITGSTDRWSIHSYGRAIDINTVPNPYVNGDTVLPPNGRPYVERSWLRPGMIHHRGVAYEALTAEGFDWGGDWNSLKDYQHFEIGP